ncbi:hypothetical protein [Arthrobacter sp. HLT1-20]
MKKFWANIALAVAVATVASGCTIVDETVPTPTEVATAAPSEPVPTTYPEPTGPVDTRLTITILTGNAMDVSTRQLFCSGSKAVSASNFPDADAACAVVKKSSGLLASKPQDTDDEKCRGTGNQVVADVIGESMGQRVRVSFMRNNLCNAKVWDSLTPLIGLGS